MSEESDRFMVSAFQAARSDLAKTRKVLADTEEHLALAKEVIAAIPTMAKTTRTRHTVEHVTEVIDDEGDPDKDPDDEEEDEDSAKAAADRTRIRAELRAERGDDAPADAASEIERGTSRFFKTALGKRVEEDAGPDVPHARLRRSGAPMTRAEIEAVIGAAAVARLEKRGIVTPNDIRRIVSEEADRFFARAALAQWATELGFGRPRPEQAN